MSKSEWTNLLIAATASVLALSLGSLIRARPRSQVILAFLPTLAVSCAIYPAMVSGASSFHDAILVCSLLAVGFALFLIGRQPWRDRLATISWALLGVVTPYTVLFALLAVVCWDQTECFG